MRRSDQRRLAVFALYQHDLTGRELESLFEREATEFTRNLAAETLAERDRIDNVIREYARDWPLERIAPLERNILRLAIHEMQSGGDVPAEVAVDEAVELAKQYCGADAPKFINGILGAIMRQANGVSEA
ncbi:MAG: transcription antitermination factor NusB [Actinobacteria bacterium]|nr:transcription antitermination factor NusB [Actinomycetota bacterium]